MNRETRLRAALDGTGFEHLAGSWARLPLAEVADLVAALRASRRAGMAAERAVRRRRRADSRKHGWYDEAQLAGRNIRLANATGLRATGDLEALASLSQFARHAQSLQRMAVAALRAQDIPDAQIAQALGISRDLVGRRYGRRNPARRRETTTREEAS